jgi:LysM repeat protein
MEPEEPMEMLEDLDREKLSKDDILRGKFIDRNFEKIIKLLKEPRKPNPRDYVVIVLLVLLIAIVLFKPTGGGVRDNQEELMKKIDVLTRKVDHLEKELLALGGMDENYDVIQKQPIEDLAARKSPEPTPEKTEKPEPTKSIAASPEPSAKPEVSATPKPGGGKKPHLMGKTYKVQNGDTLSSICSRVYKTQDPAVIKLLGKYNNLKGPHFDMYPGDTIKIPPKELLLRKAKKAGH